MMVVSVGSTHQFWFCYDVLEIVSELVMLEPNQYPRYRRVPRPQHPWVTLTRGPDTSKR